MTRLEFITEMLLLLVAGSDIETEKVLKYADAINKTFEKELQDG